MVRMPAHGGAGRRHGRRRRVCRRAAYGCQRAIGTAVLPPVGGASLSGESSVAQCGAADRTSRPSRQVRPLGLLDPRLHQLHAHHSRTAETGARLAERVGSDRRPLRQVRQRKGQPEHQGGRAPLPDRAPRGQRLGFRHLETVRRAGLAQSGADRPRGIRRLGAQRGDDLRATRRRAEEGGALLPPQWVA